MAIRTIVLLKEKYKDSNDPQSRTKEYFKAEETDQKTLPSQFQNYYENLSALSFIISNHC